jgi:hypothetical protein
LQTGAVEEWRAGVLFIKLDWRLLESGSIKPACRRTQKSCTRIPHHEPQSAASMSERPLPRA